MSDSSDSSSDEDLGTLAQLARAPPATAFRSQAPTATAGAAASASNGTVRSSFTSLQASSSSNASAAASSPAARVPSADPARSPSRPLALGTSVPRKSDVKGAQTSQPKRLVLGGTFRPRVTQYTRPPGPETKLLSLPPVVKPKKRARAAASAASKRPKKKPRRHPLETKWNPSKYTFRDPIPLESDQSAQKWWERETNTEEMWSSLEHNGLIFPPPYLPHGVPVIYEGKRIGLSPEAEEAATWFAALLEHDYTKKLVFRDNFWHDWKKILGPTHVIAALSKVDFTPIFEHLAREKELKKARSKDKALRERNRSDKEASDRVYKWCLVDGIREQLANPVVEPPGLFRGRGEHPKQGRIKKRIVPEDVTLNMSSGVPVPKCPIPGHQWGNVIHNKQVSYVARWIENVNRQQKFVYLHASSRFKGESDMAKYETARRLKDYIDKIRAAYMRDMRNKSDKAVCQRGTAMWFIDRLAIRVGGEKDLSSEADTVGVCTLRVEHVEFHRVDREDPKYEITLDFLGKDSMPYTQRVTVLKEVFGNLIAFCRNKDKKQQVFDKLRDSDMNKFLNSLMPDLSAKVFRTYNASVTLEAELETPSDPNAVKPDRDASVDEKKWYYDEANKKVAILCNHQKSVSKSWDTTVEKWQAQLRDIKRQVKLARLDLAVAQGRASYPRSTAVSEATASNWSLERIQKELAKRDILASGASKPKEWFVAKLVNGTKDRKRKPEDQAKSALETVQRRLRKREKEIDMKESLKEVALGTSKINYMDPRITIAWCKRMEMPVGKVFNKSLLEKFPWAMETSPGFAF